MENLQIIDTLREVAGVINESNRIAEKNKKNFNVLECLTRFHLEELHSRFLGYLLDPKASHDCGTEFLRLFLKEIYSEEIYSKEICQDIVTGKVKVYLEKSFSFYENEELITGRIDILIETQARNIVIENKITARDQPNQLERYYLYCKNEKLINKKDFDIYYLTLNGLASIEAENSKTIFNYSNISYRQDILVWLEKSISWALSQDKPLENIEFGITSYSKLLKEKLLHLPTKEAMNDIKDELLKNNRDILYEVEEISEALDYAKNEALLDFWKDVETIIRENIKDLGDKWMVDSLSSVKEKHGHLRLYLDGFEGIDICYEPLCSRNSRLFEDCKLYLWKDVESSDNDFISDEMNVLLKNNRIEKGDWFITEDVVGDKIIKDKRLFSNKSEERTELAKEYAKKLIDFAKGHKQNIELLLKKKEAKLKESKLL